MQKNILFLIVILTIFIETSCKKTTTTPVSTTCTVQNSSLVGRWKPTKYTENGKDVTNDTNINTVCNRTAILDLRSDQTFYYTNSNSTCDTFSGTWSLSSSINANYITFRFFGVAQISAITMPTCNTFTFQPEKIMVTYSKM